VVTHILTRDQRYDFRYFCVFTVNILMEHNVKVMYLLSIMINTIQPIVVIQIKTEVTLFIYTIVIK
jgi:hypothetical protein